MYHYVSGKEELLARSWSPRSRRRSPAPAPCSPTTPGPPRTGCGELCRTDVELLCAGPHNLGGLYLLPEVRTERFAGFHAVRAELKDGYRQLIAATTAGAALAKGELDLRTDLVFG